MQYIRKISKLLFLLTLFLLFIPNVKEIKIKERVDTIINSKKENKSYEGYIYIPRFNYRNIIKRGNVLDDNLVELLSFSDEIGGSNVILAGHNNRYVFNKLYNLKIGDEIVISDFSIDYNYIVTELKYIKVDDYSIFSNNDSLTLITCSDNNQIRYVVIAKRR